MATKLSHFSCLLLLCLVYNLLICGFASEDDRKSYIVYMGERPDKHESSVHLRMLQEAIGSDFSSEFLLHSFSRSFNGFVVKLSKDQVQKIAGMPGVVSVFPNGKKKLHTTRSWDFMGFTQKVKRTSLESDIIIGMLDSGIWPESQSFSDEGFGPPPAKWKGSCHGLTNFTCNNKIIGAKFYQTDGMYGPSEFVSPRDAEGHGTHTASTAAGGLARMASLYGLGKGTARGGVPSARIAVYKVCWGESISCDDADILRAFDDAIADGVDIISISAGGLVADDYFNDSIAIGSFHAMKNGILTSTSAGNEGPSLGTITNFSPWSLSVAASTIDRKFFTKVKLGNKRVYDGISINTFRLKKSRYPIIYGGNAPNITGKFTSLISRFCAENSLDPKLVKGKIVVCDSTNMARPFLAGAVGTVLQGPAPRDVAWPYPFPASCVGPEEGGEILSYITSTRNATATIYKSDETKDTLAPYVASFSSRGPNPVTPDILAPDITAPGVNILAAFSLASSVSETAGDNRIVPYNIVSGTSMACPHATGAAAYIKSYHPKWSPAAIKSALMTTAFRMTPQINTDAEFAYGSGHINPVIAINPGLVYDIEPNDYIRFLCGQGYDTSHIQLLTGDKSTCSEMTNITVWDLNYPSFVVPVLPSQFASRVFNRVVTNVGSPTSTYKATVVVPDGLNITVKPEVLSFTSLGQKLPYELTVEGIITSSIASASLVWSDGVHQVRSPIIVYVV